MKKISNDEKLSNEKEVMKKSNEKKSNEKEVLKKK
jgi:hypothetical protein